MTTFELWNADIASSLVPWAVAAGALIVALLSAERTNVWKRRYRAKTTENAALRDALADARYQRTARQQPLDVGEWVEPENRDSRFSQRRRHWHTRLTWPGLNTGRLPLEYGDHLDADRLRTDPCLAPSMTERALRDWLAEDQVQSWPPLDVEGLMVARLIGEIEALDTERMEALSA